MPTHSSSRPGGPARSAQGSLKPGGGLQTGPCRAVCPIRLQLPPLKLRLFSNILSESHEEVNLPLE